MKERELPEADAITEVCDFWRAVILPLAESLRPDMSRETIGAICDRLWSAVHYEEVDGKRHPLVRVQGRDGACLAGTELSIARDDQPFYGHWRRFVVALKWLRCWSRDDAYALEVYGPALGKPGVKRAATVLVDALRAVLGKGGIADAAVNRARGRG